MTDNTREPTRPARKRVLVVDDDIDVLKGLLRLIEPHANVAVALGAEPALEHIAALDQQASGFDVVIADFNLVGNNGAWLLEQVRDRSPASERILVSGSSRFDLEPFLAAGAGPGLVDRFLEKPIDPVELIAIVS